MNSTAATFKEKLSWAMYDFANSGYATVVLTAIFNTWFINHIANVDSIEPGTATFLWTLSIAIANALILFTAPILGAISDLYAIRKRLLFITTIFCVFFTALLAIPQAGDIGLAMFFVICSYFMFASGENLIAAYLPELTETKHIGRLSGYGWALGFIGGLLTLALCLFYINYAEASGKRPEQFIPMTMLIVAVTFLVSALPAFIWLKDRSTASAKNDRQLFKDTYKELQHTLLGLDKYPDLKRFMFALTCFHAGIYIVIILAAVYASQVMGFTTQQNILLIAVVNITAAVGAFLFGHLQDRIGSVTALKISLVVWLLAIFIAWSSQSVAMFWLAANLIGLALGASQSGSRALIGLFSPVGRYGEYYGLWGLCVKFAAIIGPISYGLINHFSNGDHRSSLLVTVVFFVGGLLLLNRVDEARGKSCVTSHIKE